MKEENTSGHPDEIEAAIRGIKENEARLEVLKRYFVGKEVTLTVRYPKRATGRVAVIEHVAIEKGEPLFCCMVVRHNTDPKQRDFLNGPGWTRSFRPLRSFTLSERT